MLNNEETRAGAMACMDMLLGMAEKGGNGGRGWEAWWKNEDEAIASMLHAAGNPEGFAAGFIAVMAEYIRADLIGCGYNLNTWRKPEAAMTDEEKAAYRASYEEAAHA